MDHIIMRSEVTIGGTTNDVPVIINSMDKSTELWGSNSNKLAWLEHASV